MDDNFKKKLLRLITNRLFIITFMIFGAFCTLTVKLFDMQIVNGQAIQESLTLTRMEKMRLPAPRGTIYDRFGRPLAVNKSAYVIKINPGVQVDNLNEVVLNLATFLEDHQENYSTDFPITQTKPYTFLFDESQTREARWKDDMNVPENATAPEAVDFLREKFKVPEDMDDASAWKVIAFRSLLYINRYNMHIPITIAFDVKEETVVELEEHSEKFRSIYVDVEPLREYPGGQYVAHIIGYIRKVTDKEYEDNKDKGYTMNDNIGKTGLEKAFEANFKGLAGEQVVEMGQNGRPMRTVSTTPPTPGDKLYITLDLAYQQQVYEILENQLKEVLKNKLRGTSSREAPITQKQFFKGMVKGNNYDLKAIMNSAPGQTAYMVKEYILQTLPEFNPDTPDIYNEVKAAMTDGIETGKLTPKQMLLLLHEQGVITGDETFVANVQSGRLGVLQVILDKLDEREITPQMTNLDPCTGSAMVIDVATGGVLAAVSYPSYDNNQFVNYFNNAYYYKLNDDPTTPLYNRAFMEPRAPGSTFKMISAIAGLESGAITPNTRIYDEVAFKKANKPYARCWSTRSHGNINVVQALAFSCNYFFSDVFYTMGNTKNGNPMDSISVLMKYMIDFGLNERSGVEIGEFRDTVPDEVLAVSSPQYMEYVEKSRDPESTRKWVDGDTVRTSFGQAYNNFTAAMMAKYINALASNGIRRDLHFLNALDTWDGETVQTYTPGKEVLIDVEQSNLDVVKTGMLEVVKSGTAQSVFAGFPITVAGKTGTAQESSTRPDHSSFGGYAPADDPQIAVYVLIPYGDTPTTPASSSRVGRDIIGAYLGIDNEPELAPQAYTLSH